jgi:hypothetical protein
MASLLPPESIRAAAGDNNGGGSGGLTMLLAEGFSVRGTVQFVLPPGQPWWRCERLRGSE